MHSERIYADNKARPKWITHISIDSLKHFNRINTHALYYNNNNNDNQHCLVALCICFVGFLLKWNQMRRQKHHISLYVDANWMRSCSILSHGSTRRRRSIVWDLIFFWFWFSVLGDKWTCVMILWMNAMADGVDDFEELFFAWMHHKILEYRNYICMCQVILLQYIKLCVFVFRLQIIYFIWVFSVFKWFLGLYIYIIYIKSKHLQYNPDERCICRSFEPDLFTF